MSKKILLISPKVEAARNLAREISLAGFGVSGIATNQQSVLEHVKKELPDVIVLDVAYATHPEQLAFFAKFNNKYAIPYIALASTVSDRSTQLNGDALCGLWCYKVTANDIRNGFLPNGQTGVKTNGSGHAANGTKRGASSSNVSIIGNSPAFLRTKAILQKVAATDVTLLLSGETGSGKEVFAKYIHSISDRNDQRFVAVNCAAIPHNLIESELFGHEKGSFTGATEKRLGKFKMAERGTIFLDEVGELPLNAQSKLLRVLQEREIESVGSMTTTKINARFIAATNRDLRQMVNEGTFRADLYFRLNVFPVVVPPLRERLEDIMPLAHFFLQENSMAWDRTFKGFTKKATKLLCNYSWPGNVRELEHIVKRAALLATHELVDITEEAFEDQDAFGRTAQNGKPKRLEDIEREAIIETLACSKGKIRGKDGAAAILGVHPNTLDFKIKKLGIKKTRLFS